jgi:hypothetical protein
MIDILARDFTPVHPREGFSYTFGLKLARWNVAAAWRIVQGWDFQTRAKRLRQVRVDDRPGIILDPVKAMEFDETVPVLLVTLDPKDGERGHLIIDGAHRMYKSFQLKRKQMPGFLLNRAESKSVRL